MLTKVKLRQKPLADGKLSLYLDFYPPITDPVTGKKTRREFLQRQHNAAHIDLSDWILKYLETNNN